MIPGPERDAGKGAHGFGAGESDVGKGIGTGYIRGPFAGSDPDTGVEI
jgi:hypothetical protein